MSAVAESSRGIQLRLTACYIAVFLAPGIGLPFWPTWLASRHLSDFEIGVLLAVGPWVKLVGNPLFTQAADRLGNARLILIAAIVAALGFHTIYLGTDSFWPILAVAVFATMSITNMVPLTDGVTLQFCKARGLQYGRIRLWGSLAFMAASVVAGHLLDGRSADLVLYLMLGALTIALIVALKLPRPVGPASHRPAGGWLALMTDRRLMLFLAAASLVQSSHAMLYSFSTLYWLDAGYSESDIGIIWMVTVIAEIVLFGVGGALLQRTGVAGLLIIGAAAGILRWTLAAFFVSWPALIVVGLLHALTFAATHLAAMSYLGRHVAPGLAASAQGLYGVMASGPLLGLSMLASGWLFQAIGGLGFLAMAAMCAGSVLIGLQFLKDKSP
jgi:MFS transporter, PPP family, 3-phenylpropionic acid transporter